MTKAAGKPYAHTRLVQFLDNIFAARLWRTLKYECVYLHAWETRSQARAGIRKWMDLYNRKRPHIALLKKDCNRHKPHSSLDSITPSEVALKWHWKPRSHSRHHLRPR